MSSGAALKILSGQSLLCRLLSQPAPCSLAALEDRELTGHRVESQTQGNTGRYSIYLRNRASAHLQLQCCVLVTAGGSTCTDAVDVNLPVISTAASAELPHCTTSPFSVSLIKK